MVTGAGETGIETPVGVEAFAARLASAAYAVALRHGVRGSFADLELDLWRELREVVLRAAGERPAGEGA